MEPLERMDEEETSLTLGWEGAIPSSPGSHNSVTVRGSGKEGRSLRDDEQQPLLSQKIAERERGEFQNSPVLNCGGSTRFEGPQYVSKV